MTSLGIAYACPPNPTDLYTQDSTIAEQCSIDPKVQVYMLQIWRPILDKSASMYTDLWPNLGTTYSNPEVYFEALALLKGEQNFALLSVDSK